MKKSVFLNLSLLLLFSTGAYAQQKNFTVQSNGTAKIYTDWASAWQNTQAGDTIYLPGATFNPGTVNIDKTVTIIGIGHDPAYVYNGLYSYFNGTIQILEGADGTLLHGFQIRKVQFGSTVTNDSVTNISISRCKIFESLILGRNNPAPANNIVINECDISAIDGSNAKHIQFYKNIIHNTIANFNGNVVFSNNIFLYTSSSKLLYNMYFSTFQNNIFSSAYYPVNSGSNNMFNNNIFVSNILIDPQTEVNFWENNFFNRPLAETFVNYAGGDYHLRPTSDGVGAGTDGTDIGIYGTPIPYKEGAVPFNPRIMQDSISTKTDEEGNIFIKVQVEAQSR